MSRPATQNEPQQADVRTAFSALLAYEDDLASERGTYMQRCKTIRGQMAEVYDEAKTKGVAKKVLKATLKAHLLEKKARACREDLEADEQHEYEMLAEKLGGLAELPLGMAALDKAAPGNGESTLEKLMQA